MPCLKSSHPQEKRQDPLSTAQPIQQVLGTSGVSLNECYLRPNPSMFFLSLPSPSLLSFLSHSQLTAMASSRSFSMRQLPSLCLIVFALLRTANAECYYPTGVTANVVAGVYTSCNATASASMCCNLQNGDKCTPEGLCLSGSNAFYRDMCTDQTWKAPECIQLCTGIPTLRTLVNTR